MFAASDIGQVSTVSDQNFKAAFLIDSHGKSLAAKMSALRPEVDPTLLVLLL